MIDTTDTTTAVATVSREPARAPHDEGLADCGRASNSRYVVDLCRCDACRAAHARAQADRTRRKLYGRELFVDAGPVRERLERLYALGYTTRELARLGISKSEQRAVTSRHERTGKPVTRVTRAFAEKVRAVSGRALSDGQKVPAAPARALVAGWVRDGISVAEIHRTSGVALSTLYALHEGRVERVVYRNLKALVDHRDELDMARPRVPASESFQTVVAIDKYGNEGRPMSVSAWAEEAGVDVRLALVALRGGAVVCGHRLRQATEGDLAKAPKVLWACYRGERLVASAQTKEQLAEAMGVSIEAILTASLACYEAKGGTRHGRSRMSVVRVALDG